MKLTILTVSNKSPSWTQQAVNEFVKRLNPAPKLIELPLANRGKNYNVNSVLSLEAKNIQAQIDKQKLKGNCYTVLLDVNGEAYSTEELTKLVQAKTLEYNHFLFIIGGPDGVAEEIKQQSQLKLSMSNLTFPHTIAKIVLLEQLYRVKSIMDNHPYHRE